MASLRKITSFSADGMLPPADPASKHPATCYLIATVHNGSWQRVEPPHGGYTCAPYYRRLDGQAAVGDRAERRRHGVERLLTAGPR